MFGSYGQITDATSTSGPVDERHTEDGTGGVGLAIGYNWAKKGLPLRTELEANYRFRFDYDLRLTGRPATFDNAGYEFNVTSQVFFVNAYYDYELSRRWTLYGGGGVGAVNHTIDVDRVELDHGAKTTRSENTVNFAWNVAIGAVWQVSENWDLDLKYRFMHLGGFESGPHNDTTSTRIETDGYVSHDVVLGIVYRF